MKHLRNITCMAGLLTTPILAQAQVSDNEDKKETKTPHFVIGVQGSTSISLKNNTVRNLMDGTTGGPSSGLFLRYHIGNHFAVEAAGNYSRGSYDENVLSYDGNKYSNLNVHRFSQSYDASIHAQYYLLKKENRLRPYFGIGTGYTERKTTLHTKNTTDNQTTYDCFEKTRTGYVQFTQGLTYQINKHWQINQSTFIQREFATQRTNVGVRLGVGFTF